MGLFNSPVLSDIESSQAFRWFLLLMNYGVIIAVVIGFGISHGNLGARDSGLKAFQTIAKTADDGFYKGLAASIKTNYLPSASSLYLSAAVIDDVETYSQYVRHGDDESWQNMRSTVLLLGIIVGVFAIIFNTLYILARSDMSFLDARHLMAIHGSLHAATHLLMMVVFLHLIVMWSERELTSTTLARALQSDGKAAIQAFITTYKNGAAPAAGRHFQSARFAGTGSSAAITSPPASFWKEDIVQVTTHTTTGLTMFLVILFYLTVFAHGSVVHLGHQALTDVFSAVMGGKGGSTGARKPPSSSASLRTVSSHSSHTTQRKSN